MTDRRRQGVCPRYREGSNGLSATHYPIVAILTADPASAEAPARAVISENPELFSRFLAGAALIRANFAADGARVIGPLLNHPFHLYSRRSGGALDSEERRLGLSIKQMKEEEDRKKPKEFRAGSSEAGGQSLGDLLKAATEDAAAENEQE